MICQNYHKILPLHHKAIWETILEQAGFTKDLDRARINPWCVEEGRGYQEQSLESTYWSELQ